MRTITNELTAFSRFLRNHYAETVILASSTLFMVLNHFHPVGDRWLNSLFYFGALPLLTIVLVLRRNPLDFGLRLGNARLGLAFVVAFLVVALPVLFIAAGTSDLRGYYGERGLDLARYGVQIALYLLGWEFLFRGFMLFGLKPKFKEGAILIQMVPFTILHFGKPEAEVISCIVTGILWGFFCYRTNALWPAYVIHVVVNVANKYFVSLG
jgi:membrane protease YdiL (CAAX protease family)